MIKKYIGPIIIILILLILISLGLIKNKDFHHKEILDGEEQPMAYNLKINVNNEDLIITLVNNPATSSLIAKLKNQNLTISAHEYGNFEKVGSLGFNLPTSDTKITTVPGDLVLYQGNQISLFYNSNSWTYTMLGHVSNKAASELKDILGSNDVTMTLSLLENTAKEE